jgi:N-methylhydantoinase A
MNPSIYLGVDTGGTFTDFVLLRDDTLQVHKVLSTPSAPEQAILQGIRELGLDQLADPVTLFIVHGSTVATNAVLEGKGVTTAYITNHGLGDVLTIGRQIRRELYNLQPAPVPPPVPAEYCLETGGRLDANGEMIEPLSEADLERLVSQLEQLQPRAVAINLLFSYLDDSAERRIAAAMPKGVFVSRSSEVLPEYKEYERGMATWLNAYVGPLVEGYLQRLTRGVPNGQVTVMQSSGGTIAADQAGQQAVNMLLSGPAGGMAGARYIGDASGRSRLLTFDMGGTSTDVALIDGELQLTTEGHIAHYPVAVPMVDMHTIGAGGGSIAWLDDGGVLQVGPESAGASPGPACYGQGGCQPTVTDANLVLGRLRAEAFLGGGMSLDIEAARQAIGNIAASLNKSIEETAEGIIRIANEHMAQALRVMSVQRGIDPRELTLTSFGGAGGLHVCALAEALGMHQAMVPVHAGVLSALGMLVAPRSRQLSHSITRGLDDMPTSEIEKALEMLGKQGCHALREEGVKADDIVTKPSVDLRYQGQSYFLNVPWQEKAETSEQFHQRHQQLYGHRLELPLELVNVRVAVKGKAGDIPLSVNQPASNVAARATAALYGIKIPVPIMARESLMSGDTVTGPALITETVSTTYLAEGWRCVVSPEQTLLLEKVTG